MRIGLHSPARNAPGADEVAAIGRLASNPAKVSMTASAKYDSMSAGLTARDICDRIVEHIDGRRRVKRVVMRGRHLGQPGFELKPVIDGTRFYIKVLLCDLGTIREQMLIVSVHPDR
jgi:hypothetical protein